jgi:hypothetical protein
MPMGHQSSEEPDRMASHGASHLPRWIVPGALSVPITLAIVGSQAHLPQRGRVLLALGVWLLAFCCLSLIVWVAHLLVERLWQDS